MWPKIPTMCRFFWPNSKIHGNIYLITKTIRIKGGEPMFLIPKPQDPGSIGEKYQKVNTDGLVYGNKADKLCWELKGYMSVLEYPKLSYWLLVVEPSTKHSVPCQIPEGNTGKTQFMTKKCHRFGRLNHSRQLLMQITTTYLDSWSTPSSTMTDSVKYKDTIF